MHCFAGEPHGFAAEIIEFALFAPRFSHFAVKILGSPGCGKSKLHCFAGEPHDFAADIVKFAEFALGCNHFAV